MSQLDEVKTMLDQLPESSMEAAQNTIRFLLLQHEAETRFRPGDEQGRSAHVSSEHFASGRSGWSCVHHGVSVSASSIHRIENGELIVQTLYSYRGRKIEITETFSLAADKTNLSCRLDLSSGGVTQHHEDKFPLFA